MNSDEMDRILRHTLADFRLSRGERRVLSSVLRESGADEQQLGFLRSRAFDIAREKIDNPEALGVIEWLKEVVKTLQKQPPREAPDAEAYFSPGETCARRIINLLTSARDKVDICVFTITDDRISDAILETHRRDVAVRIITDNDKSNDPGSDVDRLERQGVPVRVDRSEYHMHHKFALFDERALLTGSYNWTRSAARYNEENLIVTHERSLTKAFCEVFDKLWESLA